MMSIRTLSWSLGESVVNAFGNASVHDPAQSSGRTCRYEQYPDLSPPLNRLTRLASRAGAWQTGGNLNMR